MNPPVLESEPESLFEMSRVGLVFWDPVHEGDTKICWGMWCLPEMPFHGARGVDSSPARGSTNVVWKAGARVSRFPNPLNSATHACHYVNDIMGGATECLPYWKCSARGGGGDRGAGLQSLVERATLDIAEATAHGSPGTPEERSTAEEVAQC